LTFSSVTDNNTTGDGAGIANERHMTLDHSAVTNNHAGHDGGGIVNKHMSDVATLTLSQSDVTNNEAGHDGGGLANVERVGRRYRSVGQRRDRQQVERRYCSAVPQLRHQQ